ncbi:unnamed protein product [Urochloa humidicola]
MPEQHKRGSLLDHGEHVLSSSKKPRAQASIKKEQLEGARGRRSWPRWCRRCCAGRHRNHGCAAAQQSEDGTRLVSLPSLPTPPSNLPHSS